MKRFKDFIKESNQNEMDYVDYLDEINQLLLSDFTMSEKQSLIFIKEYDEFLKDAWENGLTTKEAIVSTGCSN